VPDFEQFHVPAGDQYENDAGPGVCPASFLESRAVTEGLFRHRGWCRVCGQQVGAVVVREGIVRINWHERRESNA
jgi:hypothetical protein